MAKKIATKRAASRAKAKLAKKAGPAKLKAVKAAKSTATKAPHDRSAAAKRAWITINANKAAAAKAAAKA